MDFDDDIIFATKNESKEFVSMTGRIMCSVRKDHLLLFCFHGVCLWTLFGFILIHLTVFISFTFISHVFPVLKPCAHAKKKEAGRFVTP